MTALCGGNSSGPKPGVAETIIYGATEIGTILETSGNFWVKLLAPLMGVISYDAISLCGSDPPAQPSFTADEATAVLNLSFGADLTSAIDKARDWVLNYLWFQLCQCSGVTTPFVGPPLPLPSNTAVRSDQLACGSGSNFLTGGSPFSNTGAGNVNFGPVTPSGTTAKLRGTVSLVGGTPFNVTFNQVCVSQTTRGDLGQTQYSITLPQSGAFEYYFQIPPTGNASVLLGHYDGAPGAATGTMKVDAFVDTLCGAQSQDCCPPDPTIAQAIAQLNAAVTTLTTTVGSMGDLITLIQRQQVPFAYISGATHSGLTGSGEIVFSDILGLKVLPSSIPASAGIEVGDPDTLWLDSWIRWGNADGFIEREFLTSAPFISMPRYAGQFTRLGYTLRPGLSVDIVELVREP